MELITPDLLRAHIRMIGIPIAQMARDLNTSTPTIYGWINGRHKMSHIVQMGLCYYFECKLIADEEKD